MIEPTSAQVRTLYDVATATFGAKIAPKEDSELMEDVGRFLETIGVLFADHFMEHYTTTILDVVYVPFTPGEPIPGYSLWGQVSVLAHELVHVEQYHNRPLGFVVSYLAQKSSRATYEAAAFASDLALHRWRYGEGYNVRHRAENLLDYGLDEEHVDFVAEYLAGVDAMLAAGTIRPAGPAAWIAAWLTENAPGVRGV